VVGLTGTRVLIIDDDENEVLALVRALWGENIPPLYVNPLNMELDGIRALSGVRLVFLDMDLVGGGADDTSKLSAAAHCLRTLIASDNGPFLVVAWTNQPWLVEKLDEYLFQFGEIARPAGWVKIAKADCQEDGAFQIDKVRERVNETLLSCAPLVMLQAWEHECIASASDVVSELSRIAGSDQTSPAEWRSEWEKELLKIMYNCGKEYAGRKNVGDASAVLSAFCQTLNPLVADRAELRTLALTASLSEPAKRLLDSSSKVTCTSRAIARINSMLHCSYDSLAQPFSGSVYVPTDGTSFDGLFPSVGDMVRGLLASSPDSERGLLDIRTIAGRSRPVLIEANAACDHVQTKVLAPRLIGGLLLPSDLLTLFKDPEKKNWPDYIWRLGPISVRMPGGTEDSIVALIANSLFVTTTTFETLRARSALFRLRGQAFAAMQAWFASHAARPGMMLLH
jgi:hypothetical protein